MDGGVDVGLDPAVQGTWGSTGELFDQIAELDGEHYEIISCDSRQLYKEMDIGTASPPREIQRKAPHHMLGLLRPDQECSAAFYVERARLAILDVLGRGRKPVLVGGSGFYYRALKTGLFPSPPDPETRAKIEALSPQEALAELERLDPEALTSGQPGNGKIHRNDQYRIRRALEIALSTGIPYTEHWRAARKKTTQEFSFQGWYLKSDPETYRERLLARARKMVAQGLVEEAIKIRQKYGDCPGLKVLGYNFALQVADGVMDSEDLPVALAQSHAKYGKKQRTWFPKETELHPLRPEEFSETFARREGRL